MMMLSLALTMSALAQDTMPSDAELEQRLLATTDTPTIVQAPSAPWWLWPMGLLGAAGVAGVMMRSRKTSGIPGHISVLSRATLSRSASLAMIEVTDADGQTRRMLIGVGGGAPRLVSDLSAASAAQSQFSPRERSGYTEASEPPAQRAARRAAEPGHAADAIGQRLSVTTPAEPGSSTSRLSGRVAKAYASTSTGASSDNLDLVAEVLAERGKDEGAEGSDSPSDPWAKNFEALLERRSV